MVGEAEGTLHLQLSTLLHLAHLEQADVEVEVASYSVHGVQVYLAGERVPPHLLHGPPEAGGLGVVRPVVVAEEDLQLRRAPPGQVPRPAYPEQQCAAVMM